MRDRKMPEIKNYPAFSPLELEDRPLFDKLFRDDPPEFSEFTFAGLYAWKDTDPVSVSMFEACAVLRAEKYKMPVFFCPIGRCGKKDVISTILRDTKGSFICLPSRTALSFDRKSGFIIKSDRNDADYLFKTGDLALLEGRKYDGKRNLIANFKTSYKYEYLPLNELSAAECLAFEETWCSVKNCGSIKELDDERRAISAMITNFSYFGLMGGAIRVNGKARAIAIAERLNQDTLVMHVLKADPNMKGLYQIMMNEFLSRYRRDFEYVNLEQDMGIAGLRKSKLSYHPVRLAEKYTVSVT